MLKYPTGHKDGPFPETDVFQVIRAGINQKKSDQWSHRFDLIPSENLAHT
jgi:hypothetical protein